MSIHEIQRTSPLNLEPDKVIGRKDAGAKEPGIGGDRQHGRSPAGQEEEVEEVESGEAEEDDHASATAPPTSATAADAKRTGDKKTVPCCNDSYDYEQKYPEDAPYEEAAPAARVWRTYEDESRVHDANMVEKSRDNVDVLLVFAGLFSAVVTTLVAQTSQSLQPNYSAMSVSLLYESVLVQRAIANGSSVNTVAPSPFNPTIAFVPATTDVWVNGLWFTSLFLSLTTALVAVLVKQWLHHYIALPSGTPRDRSLTRQFRYAGFQKWYVQVIIGLLPALMHLALAIFLVGLVIFLHPLRAAPSWIICAGTGLVYTAYGVATILPTLFPQWTLGDLVYVFLRRAIPRGVTWSRYRRREFLSSLRDRDLSAMFRYLPRVQARPQALMKIESKFVRQMSTKLAAEALHWLLKVSSNPTVQSIVIQSIGGLPMASEARFLELRGDSAGTMRFLWQSLLERCLLEMKHSGRSYIEPVPGMELKIGRLLRFDPNRRWTRYDAFLDTTPSLYSTELAAAILSNGYTLHDRETLNQSVSLGVFLMDSTRSSKLSPRSWYHLLMVRSQDVFSPLNPDNDHYANMFPLLLCFAISKSFTSPPESRVEGFNSPLVLVFEDALPYCIDKIYDDVLSMFSKFIEDPPSANQSAELPKSLRTLAVAIKFLLHRLSLPNYNMSHTTILDSLTDLAQWIQEHILRSQEAAALILIIDS